jgi:hypothetical protein
LIYRSANQEDRNAKARERRRQNPEKDIEYQKKYRQKYPLKMTLRHALKRAKAFDVPYDLDLHIPELEKRLSAMKCEMTGIALRPSMGGGIRGQRVWNTPSLDRIIPAKGYVYSNVRIVCWAMNCAMGTWGEEILKELLLAWQQEK